MKNLLEIIFPEFDFLILQVLAITLTAILLPKLKITSILGPISAAVLLSWLNDVYWDTRLFFDLPSNLSLDAFLLLICNSILFWIVVKLVPGIEISGILTPIYSALILTVSSLIISQYANDINWTESINFIINLIQNIRDYFLSETK